MNQLTKKLLLEIPQIQDSRSLTEVIKKYVSFLKQLLGKSDFQSQMAKLGFASRVTYRAIVIGKRLFPKNKVFHLANEMDLGQADRIKLLKMSNNQTQEFTNSELTTKYVLGSQDILNSPINTLILKLCGLQRPLSLEEIVFLCESLSTEDDLKYRIHILLEHELLMKNSEGKIVRNLDKKQLSTPNGIKLDYAKNYITQSSNFAISQYELPSTQREFQAFSAKIKKSDFPVLKDLIRSLKENIYSLDSADSDIVIQVNLNAVTAIQVSKE